MYRYTFAMYKFEAAHVHPATGVEIIDPWYGPDAMYARSSGIETLANLCDEVILESPNVTHDDIMGTSWTQEFTLSDLENPNLAHDLHVLGDRHLNRDQQFTDDVSVSIRRTIDLVTGKQSEVGVISEIDTIFQTDSGKPIHLIYSIYRDPDTLAVTIERRREQSRAISFDDLRRPDSEFLEYITNRSTYERNDGKRVVDQSEIDALTRLLQHESVPTKKLPYLELISSPENRYALTLVQGFIEKQHSQHAQSVEWNNQLEFAERLRYLPASNWVRAFRDQETYFQRYPDALKATIRFHQLRSTGTASLADKTESDAFLQLYAGEALQEDLTRKRRLEAFENIAAFAYRDLWGFDKQNGLSFDPQSVDEIIPGIDHRNGAFTAVLPKSYLEESFQLGSRLHLRSRTAWAPQTLQMAIQIGEAVWYVLGEGDRQSELLLVQRTKHGSLDYRHAVHFLPSKRRTEAEGVQIFPQPVIPTSSSWTHAESVFIGQAPPHKPKTTSRPAPSSSERSPKGGRMPKMKQIHGGDNHFHDGVEIARTNDGILIINQSDELVKTQVHHELPNIYPLAEKPRTFRDRGRTFGRALMRLAGIQYK